MEDWLIATMLLLLLVQSCGFLYDVEYYFRSWRSFYFLFLCGLGEFLQFVCPYIQKWVSEVTFVDQDLPLEELKKRFVQIQKPSLLKPYQTALRVLDIENLLP